MAVAAEPAIRARLRAAVAEVRRLDELIAAARSERDEAFLAAIDAGWTGGDVARATGMGAGMISSLVTMARHRRARESG